MRLLAFPLILAAGACTASGPPPSPGSQATLVAPYEPGPIPDSLCGVPPAPTAALPARPVVHRAGTTAVLIPPPPMPPGPPDAPAYLQIPEPVLTGTGDPRVDEYLRRVLRDGGPGWRPYLLRAFAGVRANSAVLRGIDPQPAGAGGYVRRFVTPERVAAGRRLYRELQGQRLFEGEQRAPLEVLLALWGIHSDYGANPPRFDTIEALANLGACGRGPDWSSFSIYHAVQILAEGRVERARARAFSDGRIGQARVFPDHYLRFAQDGDKDGRVDIWASRADILSTIQRNWILDWDPSVPLIAEIEPVSYDTKVPNSIRRLRAQLGWEGVHRRVDGRPWPANPEQAFGWQPLTPAGPGGPTFVVSGNFRMLGNQSHYQGYYRNQPDEHFALAVALLAERIAGRPAPSKPIG